MRLHKIWWVGIIIMGVASLSYAQVDIDDRGEETTNHNYFVANQTPYLRNLLALNEKFHMNGCPHNPDGTLGDIRLGHYKDAASDMEEMLIHWVNHPKVLQLLGFIAVQMKQTGMPIKYFERAVSLYPNYPLTHAQYGAYLVMIGNLQAGIDKLKFATEKDPKLTAGFVWLAQAYQKIGDAKLAGEAAARARELGYQGKLSDFK